MVFFLLSTVFKIQLITTFVCCSGIFSYIHFASGMVSLIQTAEMLSVPSFLLPVLMTFWSFVIGTNRNCRGFPWYPALRLPGILRKPFSRSGSPTCAKLPLCSIIRLIKTRRDHHCRWCCFLPDASALHIHINNPDMLLFNDRAWRLLSNQCLFLLFFERPLFSTVFFMVLDTCVFFCMFGAGWQQAGRTRTAIMNNESSFYPLPSKTQLRIGIVEMDRFFIAAFNSKADTHSSSNKSAAISRARSSTNLGFS